LYYWGGYSRLSGFRSFLRLFDETIFAAVQGVFAAVSGVLLVFFLAAQPRCCACP
jgi:hypothetical protein